MPHICQPQPLSSLSAEVIQCPSRSKGSVLGCGWDLESQDGLAAEGWEWQSVTGDMSTQRCRHFTLGLVCTKCPVKSEWHNRLNKKCWPARKPGEHRKVPCLKGNHISCSRVGTGLLFLCAGNGIQMLSNLESIIDAGRSFSVVCFLHPSVKYKCNNGPFRCTTHSF